MNLTQRGIKNYKKVISLILEFFRAVRENWLKGNESIDLFKESKMISDLSWKLYRSVDPEESVCTLANRMLITSNPGKILEEIYGEAIIETIDVQDIRDFLGEFTIDKVKVVLLGNQLLDDTSSVQLPECIST